MSSPHFSVATAIEKDRIYSDKAFVLLLEIVATDYSGTVLETLRFAKNSENVVYQGNEYIASNFTVKQEMDSISDPRLTITAEDPSGIIRDRLEIYSGAIGFNVSCLVVNTGNIAQPPEVQYDFKIIQATQNGYQVSFTLGIDNPLAQRFPNRLQYRDQCTKQYKGPLCKYSGSMTSCDYTRTGSNGCVAHGNESNYGGFPGLLNLLQ
jgi:phage-related protein